MNQNRSAPRTCSLCGRSFPPRQLVAGALIRDSIADLIRAEHPEWSNESVICREDLSRYRAQYVSRMLASERGELGVIEQQVLESLKEHEILASDVDSQFTQKWSLGERLADRIAAFGGSWTFLIWFFVFIGAWIGLNSARALWHPADPYPFILLNLLLSCVAAVQAPIIMMSQNRQEAKDRVRSQHDYQVDLKAELEIRHLHEKIDHLLSHQWERLIEIQEIQMELMEEVRRKR